MKKVTLILSALLISMAALATDLTGLKIYVNPGHGGYDANDRSIWTIPVPATWSDSAGYWESKSNLKKALALEEMLKKAGATVIMSRTENTSGARDVEYYPDADDAKLAELMAGGDRYLSAIAEEANANNVDHFLSIHSNALGNNTNYLLLLWHGYNNKPTVATSDDMARSSGAIQITNQLTAWSAAAPLYRGDFDFYGDNMGLGVLRPLTVPGFLSEGSFHDYAPETHRLCNYEYCKLEAARFFQHFHNYFKRDLPGTGIISGFVKSSNERVDVLGYSKFTYRPNTDDQWLPINDATVELYNEGGTLLKTYVTDQWYNGIFAFFDLQPGTYTVKVSAKGYQTKNTTVSLAANQIAAVKTMVKNARIVAQDYPEPEQDGGVVALNEYDFEDTGINGNKDFVEGAKRVLVRGDKYYVLHDNQISEYELATNKFVRFIKTTGISNLGDMAFTADDYLIATNRGNSFEVYTWDDLGDTPRLLFSKISASTNIGWNVAVHGSRWDCTVYTTEMGANPRIFGVKYNEDKTDVEMKYARLGFNIQDADHAHMTIAPTETGNDIFIDSELMAPVQVTFDWTNSASETTVSTKTFSSTDVETLATGGNFFRYAQHIYLVQPVCKADATEVSFMLFDVTNGLDKAVKASGKFPAAGISTAASAYMTAYGVVDGYDMHIYLFAENEGIGHYRTVSKPVANIYASELSLSDDRTFHFLLNEDATSVMINIYRDGETVGSYNAGALKKGRHDINNPFGGEGYDSYSVTAQARPVGAVTKISDDSPIFQFYAPRGVTVDRTPSSPYFGRIYAIEGLGGQITEGKPAQARKTETGIYILDAAFTDITKQDTKAYTGSNIEWGTSVYGSGYQMAMSRPSVGPDGTVFIASSAFASTGVYLMDPANPGGDFTPVFAGKPNSTNGQVLKGSRTVHNQVMHTYVTGTGADRQLYTYDRDATPYSCIYRYDIGNLEEPWNAAPSATIYDDLLNGSKFANGNGQIASDGRNGFWISQYRAEGQNTATNPAFVHVSEKGVVDCTSVGFVNGSLQGGMAVSADGSLIASASSGGMVEVLGIEFDANGVPSLSNKFTIKWGSAGNSMAIAFDAANNLYIISNSNERLMVYSLPNLENSYTTRVALSSPMTGLKESKSSLFSVYPAVATSEVTVKTNGSVMESCTLFDLTGKSMAAIRPNSSEATLDVSPLTGGIYYIRVSTAEGTAVKSFIKK